MSEWVHKMSINFNSLFGQSGFPTVLGSNLHLSAFKVRKLELLRQFSVSALTARMFLHVGPKAEGKGQYFHTAPNLGRRGMAFYF
jgi:hypothetical protein